MSHVLEPVELFQVKSFALQDARPDWRPGLAAA